MTRVLIVIMVMVMAGASMSVAHAQTRGVRDTATAYSARLNAKDSPATLNPNRINSRVASRIDTRLSLRVERYHPGSVEDPAAAFATRPNDNARMGTDTTLSPLSSFSPSSNGASPLGGSGSRSR